MAHVCDTYWNTAIYMSIKLHYIGEYTITQVLRVSTQVLKYLTVKLKLNYKA